MAENAFKADWPSFALGFNTGKSKGGGGVELNIHYGMEPPEDTTKLWVKTSEPSGVTVSAEKKLSEGGQEEELVKLGATMTRLGKCVGAYGEKILVFGGSTTQASDDASNAIYSFDTVSKTNSYIGNNLAYKVTMAAYAVYGSKIFAFGGLQKPNDAGVLNSILEFDMETKASVVSSATLPNGLQLYGACAATVDSKIYIFGGTTTFKGTGTNIVLIFDPETKEWLETTRNLPVEVKYASCAAVGSKIYIFGGADKTNKKTLTDIIRYDTATGEFETLPAKLPEGRRGMGCCAVENVICLFAGENSYSENVVGNETKNIWIFDTDREELIVSDLLFDQWIMVNDACANGKKAYVMFSQNLASRSNIYEYSPSLGCIILDRGRLQIYPHPINNIFPFINTDSVRAEIGVEKVYKGDESNQAKPVEAALCKDGTWQTI